MGIKERQERDREAVRRSILDAARDLFVTEGYQNVSIRKIAERIEYSPAAIYSYFPSKDDIFFALAEEGFRLLYGTPEGYAAIDVLPPLDRIRASFLHLYQFSVEHSEYFSLMFVDRSVPSIGRAYERFAFAREMKARLLSHLQQCVDAGFFASTVSPLAALRVFTMGIVGVAVMRMSERLAPGENAQALAEDLVDVTIAGLQSGLTLRFHTVDCPLDEAAASSTDTADHSRSSS